jgi:hypothetical protein
MTLFKLKLISFTFIALKSGLYLEGPGTLLLQNKGYLVDFVNLNFGLVLEIYLSD